MKVRSLLLSMVMLASTLIAKADLQPVNGWYEISNYDELQEFIMLLRNGQTGICGKLTADIDMSGVKNFMPLAYKRGDEVDCSFSGQFDGQCHVIRNMNLELAEDQTFHLGFFGHIKGGSVMNLGFENARLVSTYGAPVGVLAAWAENANITNCYTTGDIEVVTENDYCGGLVGYANSGTTFTNCYTTAALWGVATADGYPTFVNFYDADGVEDIAASGELCFVLNGDQSVIRFRQTIGTDTYPVFGESHKQVYAVGSLNCDGTPNGAVTYSNTPSELILPPHDYDEDGYCVNCGVSNGIITPDEEGWYNVTLPEELRYVSREVVNKGNNKVKIRLMNDIDMSGIPNFPPMGTYADNGIQIGFQGVFDGQNHIISNLTVIVYDQVEAGLFSRINGGGYIKNFGVVNADINNMAGIRAGVIAGEIHACTVDNVFSAGNIYVSTSHAQRGGISAEAAEATLNNCYTTFDVLSVGTAPRAQNNCWYGDEARLMAQSGELCYMMNHQDFQHPTWFQTLDEDEFPVLDNTHGVVYPIGEGEYASAVTADDFRAMVNGIIDDEVAKYQERVATKSLVNNYVKKLNALRGSLLDDFFEAYNAMAGLRTAISESESAYAAYDAKVAEVTAYLDKNQSLEGEDVDLLVEYLEEEFEPNEAFPNGSYTYIMNNRSLLADELKDEVVNLQAMQERAIVRGYSAGADISSLIVNADFSDQTNGWTYHYGGQDGWWNNLQGTVRNIAHSNKAMDLSQTVSGLKNGIYEVRISSYTEFAGATSDASYNYTGFIYANDNRNYVKTQRADLQPEEMQTEHPSDFSERWDSYGELQGYAPSSVQGVSYAFQGGYYENRILANVTDGTLTLGISNGGMNGLTNASYYTDAKLIYLGSMEDAEEGVNAMLEVMVENANHVIADYEPSVDVYAEAPNYTAQLTKQLTNLVNQASSASSVTEKYNLIHDMGEVFQAIYDSKCVYLEMAGLIRDISDAYYEQDCSREEEEYVQDMADQMFEIYESGSASDQEVLQWIDKVKQDPFYLLTYGMEPEQTDGVYQLSTPQNLVWFSYYINNVARKNRVRAVLTNDIDMSPINNFRPIGTYIHNFNENEFVGEFDGQGHVIRNLKVYILDGSEAGFFGRALDATVKNLGIVNASIVNDGGTRAGVLGGEIHRSNVINCYTTGNLEVVTDHEQHAGIAGECAATALRSCWTTYPELTNAATVEENCFYGDEAEAIMATGEMAFRLNGDQSLLSWYQTIGQDAYPVLDQTHAVVYLKGEVDCGGNSVSEVTYTNEKQTAVLPDHQYDEDGICIVCGADGGKCAPAEDGYFHLSNAYQLRYFANYINTVDERAKARLDCDIDMSVIDNFPMLGCYSDYLPNPRHFRGEFDGQGHVIRNLKVTVDDRWEAGFCSRSSGGTFRNLGIENATITNTHPDGVRAGVLGGELHQTNVYNCWTCGEININTTHSQKGGFGGEAAESHFYGCWTTYRNIGAMATPHNSYAGDEVAATIATGELCYNLNAGKVVSPAWRQTLGLDSHPVLDSTHKVVFLDDYGNYTNGSSKLPRQKGTLDDPFIIMDVNDLLSLNDYLSADQVNYVELGTDLDMSRVSGWEPICNNTAFFIDFDGKGHVISNLTCNAASSYNSFFGVLNGNLRNIGFVNMTVADGDRTGMIAAKVGFEDNRIESVIEHVYVDGTLTCAGAFGGGMFGQIQGHTVIRNCYANVAVNSTSTYTGGIVGQVSGRLTMENVYAAGSTTRGGGIVGGGQDKDTPASRYTNVAVWNNDYEIFGRTVRGDVREGVLFYDSTNFAELQRAVVAWDASVWSCDMEDDSYPVLVGSANMPDDITHTPAALSVDGDAVCDITGRRVLNSQLKRGIYIIGGKKVLFR